jgi:NAD(P)H-dependent FMN reductase
MDNLFVPVVLGTARPGRQSEKVAKFILAEVAKNGFATEIVDVKDYSLTATDINNPPAKWKEIVNKAAGLIIVSPEYNHGYPGELKLLLDSLYGDYKHKPVGLCTVSAGPAAGARLTGHLRQVFGELGLISVNPVIGFGKVQELFNDDGTMKDSTYFSDQVSKLCDEIKFVATRLA